MDEQGFFDILTSLMEMMFASEELDKLEDMLLKEDIPYKRRGTQIAYYGKELPEDNPNQGLGIGSICSVIAHGFGSDEGLLEISGLVSEEENEDRGILGYLTAEEVFIRIQEHFKTL